MQPPLPLQARVTHSSRRVLRLQSLARTPRPAAASCWRHLRHAPGICTRLDRRYRAAPEGDRLSGLDAEETASSPETEATERPSEKTEEGASWLIDLLSQNEQGGVLIEAGVVGLLTGGFIVLFNEGIHEARAAQLGAQCTCHRAAPCLQLHSVSMRLIVSLL